MLHQAVTLKRARALKQCVLGAPCHSWCRGDGDFCAPTVHFTVHVLCMAQVRKVVWDLFRLVPDASAAELTDVAQIQAIIQPLGLATKRAPMIKRFSADYLNTQVILTMQGLHIGPWILTCGIKQYSIGVTALLIII